MQPLDYDIIVIGGGHAGAEAAWAAANRLRHECADGPPGRVALITMDPSKIGSMSCNPAIGGLAKGQMVREIDALGGLMGLAADATGIQFRVLNASKGSAVRGPRCQSDKYRYADEVQRLLRTRTNLDILTGAVDDFLIERGRCIGVMFRPTLGDAPDRTSLRAGAVVLTTGTFMRGLMHTGERKTQGGRVGEGPAIGISEALQRLGFELGRLKTGTPPRLAAESIDLMSLDIQPGDDIPIPFSEMTAPPFPILQQRPCWITHTSAAIHDRILANLDRAPMYNGQIETAGPRYCPSIEDKVVRFRDRTQHHVFLEPESLATNEIYCNGISTSLPADVQDDIVRRLPGCERAVILRYGYAVEYDMVYPHQIDATCMTKHIPGLFLAGQINGTSGYEEAAGQGLIAGVNAVQYLRGGDLLRLRRDQAYIGVLMDDLVTKTPREPYRMFTSRAEHRLLLRADNADERLTPLGRDLGLVDDARWAAYGAKQDALESLKEMIRTRRVEGSPMRQWARRPEVDADTLLRELRSAAPEQVSAIEAEPTVMSARRLVERILADIQYAGYIERSRIEIARLASQEEEPLPVDLDYHQVSGLRTESAQTLNKFRPATLGQARRLAGVTPSDLMIVSLWLRRSAASGSHQELAPTSTSVSDVAG